MPSAILLDVGGVFFVPHHDLVITALREAGIAVADEDCELAHFRGVAAMDERPDSDGPWHRYLTGYLASLGAPSAETPRAIRTLPQVWEQPSVYLWSQVLSDSVESLPLLTARGLKLAVVSNSDGTVEQALSAQGICQVGRGRGVEVTCVVDSAIAGVEKADPAILMIALDSMGVEASSSVYVGDSVRYDVACARAAGVRATHFDPYGLCPRPSDHTHVRSLRELADPLG